MLCYVYGQNVIFIATFKYTPIALKLGMHIFPTYCNIFKPVEQHLEDFLKIPCIDGPVYCPVSSPQQCYGYHRLFQQEQQE